MIGRLLVAFVAVIVAGALIDSTVHREAVGRMTAGDRERQQARGTGEDHVAAVTTAYTLARREGFPDGRYSVYVIIRDRAPAATIILDQTSPAAALSRSSLRYMSAASSVHPADLSEVALPDVPHEASGLHRYGSWTLRTAPGQVSTLVVLGEGRTAHLVDARLLSPEEAERAGAVPLALAEGPEGFASVLEGREPTLARVIAGESAVLLLFLIAGGLLLPRSLLPTVARPPIALVVGAALHAAVGILRLPGVIGPAVTLLGVVACAFWYRRMGEPFGWRREDRAPLVVAAGLVVGIVAVARVSGFLLIGGDSTLYLLGGAALADGALDLMPVDAKRGITQQALHAAGFVAGAEGLQALGAVLLVAAAAILLTAAGHGWGLREQRAVGPAGLLVVLSILVSPQMRAMAAFVGSHMILATFLLVLVVLLGQGIDAPTRRALLPAVFTIIAAIVLIRAEGAALVGLMLVGTFGVRAGPLVWRGAWAALGGSAIGWALVLAGSDQATSVTLLSGASGLLSLAVAAGAPHLPARIRRAVPTLVATALWITTILLVRRDEVQIVDVAITNLGQGAGRWGVVAPLLLIGGILAVRHTADTQDLRTLVARWFIIGFLPLSVIAKLADGIQRDGAGVAALLVGGGTVGWGDSLNRMWAHAVLVLGLLLIIAIQQSDAPARTGRVSAATRVADVALLAIAMWTALQWQPRYVPISTVPEEATLVSVEGVEPIGELLSGSEVWQNVLLPPLSDVGLPDGSVPMALCVDVRFVTFQRGLEGEVRVEIERGSSLGSVERRAALLGDWLPIRACIRGSEEVRPDGLGQGDVLLGIRVTAEGTTRGAAPSVLQGQGSGIGALATLTGEDGVGVQRRVGDLVVDVVLEYERPVGLLEFPLQRSVVLLPWIGLLIGTASFLRRPDRDAVGV